MNRIKSDHGKSTAFWLELVLSLCAMMICGCICLFVFVHADQESKRSRAETEGLLRLQTAAEQFKSNPDSAQALTAGTFYDGAWNPLPDSAGAVYRMAAQVSEEKGLVTVRLDMTAVKEEKSLCLLTVKKYLPERGRN